MKTLKKTLCLVLALVMVFGLCSVSASAKLEYTDNDKINYKEAVDVLSGIGILKGDTSGFRPTDYITRAEAAKIMAYILIGNATEADAVKAETDPFPDVPASHWASGYIAYCATSGIIVGKGDGYHPNENVTGLEFAKMLLCALGYGTKSNEYIGKDWAINTSKDAIRHGVFDDNLAGANTNPATREQCALYAFNVIARERDGVCGLKKVTYSQLAGDYVANGAFSSLGVGGSSVDANKKATFAADFGLSTEDADESPFGLLAGHHWIQKIGNNTKIISGDYDDDERLVAVYTTPVSSGDIYSLIVDRFGKSFLDDVTAGASSGNHAGDFAFYVNSSKNLIKTDTDYTFNGVTTLAVKPENFKKGESKNLNYTGNGVQTYVYAWTNAPDPSKPDETTDHIRICIIDTYLAKVTKVIEARGGRDPETDIVLVDGGYNEASVNPASTSKYTKIPTDEFKVGDYVLVTIAADDTTDGKVNTNLTTADKTKVKVVDIELAPTLETEVSKYIKKGTDVSFVLNGETYVTAKNVAGNDTGTSGTVSGEEVISAGSVNNTIVDGDDHIIYLDKFGYLVATSKVAEVSNFAYVAQFGKKTNDATTLNDEDILRAHVYFADGTDDILTVNTKAGIFGGTGNEVDMASSFPDPGALRAAKVYYGTDSVAAKTADDTSAATSTHEANNIARIGVYEVSVDKAKGKVTLVDKYTTANIDANSYVTKGQANIFKEAGNSYTKSRANENTVFFYVKGVYKNDNFKVTVYKGINDVPTVNVTDKNKALLVNYITRQNAAKTRTIMRAAYVPFALEDGTTSDIVYFFGGTQSTANFRKNDNSSSSEDRWTVDYFVYGGDGSKYVTISYDSSGDADTDIAGHRNRGFVKVVNGKLTYVAEDSDHSACAHDPAHLKTAVDNKILYTVTGKAVYVVGDDDDTLQVTYTSRNSAGTGMDTTDNMSQINMPLYKLRENGYVYDLRDKSAQLSTTRGPIENVDELITAFVNGDVTQIQVAISVEGTDASSDTNVLTGLYILGAT